MTVVFLIRVKMVIIITFMVVDIWLVGVVLMVMFIVAMMALVMLVLMSLAALEREGEGRVKPEAPDSTRELNYLQPTSTTSHHTPALLSFSTSYSSHCFLFGPPAQTLVVSNEKSKDVKEDSFSFSCCHTACSLQY